MILLVQEKQADKCELPMDSGDKMFHTHGPAPLFETRLFPSSAVCSAHFHLGRLWKRILGTACCTGQLLVPFGDGIML